MHLRPRGFGETQQSLRAGQRVTAFEASDGGLARSHPRGKFRLRQPGTETCADQFSGNLEFRRKGIIFSLDLGVRQKASFQLFEVIQFPGLVATLRQSRLVASVAFS